MANGAEFTSELLRTSARAYAQASMHTLQSSRPGIVETALPATFASPVDDIEVRILQIAASVGVDHPSLLAEALGWYKVAFHHRDVPPAYLPATVQAIEKTLERELPRESFALVRAHVAAASRLLEEAPVERPSHLSRDAPHGETAMRFLLANLEGRGDDALDLVRGALRDGVSIADVHDHVLAPAQREAGRMWLMAEIPIADEHYGSAVVERALWLLQEQVPRPPADAPVVMTMGVGGNLHELGLRMVAQRLQLSGYRVHHLGPNMPASDLEWALRDREIDAVAMSASMLLHLGGLRDAVRRLRAALDAIHGDPRARPVLVGGEPFRVAPGLHEAVGADASCCDASEAPDVVGRLLGR